MDVKIHPSWKEKLSEEFEQPYFKEIVAFLKTERMAGNIIYPPGSLIFEAFEHATFQNTKVVLLGQDPYHGAGQAHGLSFSVPDNVAPPPSLKNVFKEIKDDLGLAVPTNYGNLTCWANQGVLLLNSILTVRAGEASSHQKIGWQQFTDAVIRKISDEKENVVFLLWGKFAHSKQDLIDETKHCVLKAAHPSPFAADKGFFGCKHFSRANDYLRANQLTAIDWSILPV